PATQGFSVLAVRIPSSTRDDLKSPFLAKVYREDEIRARKIRMIEVDQERCLEMRYSGNIPAFFTDASIAQKGCAPSHSDADESNDLSPKAENFAELWPMSLSTSLSF